MGALITGLVGLLIVAVAGTIALRQSQTSDERSFHRSHNVSFALSFLVILVGPGILSLFGVIPDPLFGPGRTFPFVTASCGAVVALVIAILGTILVLRDKVPARRRFLIEFHANMGLSFLVFFTLPGLLADFHFIPDPMAGLGTAADLLFFFFLLRWSEKELARFREADPAPALDGAKPDDGAALPTP